MPEKRSSSRGSRATPPPRDILAGRVRAEELPDVARPDAPALPEQSTSADPAASASRNAPRAHALAQSVLELGRAPLAVTEATLEGQARTIDAWVARGAVPTVLVPGAVVLTAELRLLTRMLRAVSGPKSSGP